MRIYFKSAQVAKRLIKEFGHSFPSLSSQDAKDKFALLCGYRRYAELAKVLKQTPLADNRPVWTLDYIENAMGSSLRDMDIYSVQAFCCKFLSEVPCHDLFPIELMNDIRCHKTGIVIFCGTAGTGTTTLLTHAASVYEKMGVFVKFIGYAEEGTTLSPEDYSLWEHAELPYANPVIIDPKTRRFSRFDISELDFENTLYLSCAKHENMIDYFFKQQHLPFGATIYSISGTSSREFSRRRARFDHVRGEHEYSGIKTYPPTKKIGRQAEAMVTAFSGRNIIIAGDALDIEDCINYVRPHTLTRRPEVNVHGIHATSLSAAYHKYLEGKGAPGDVLIIQVNQNRNNDVANIPSGTKSIFADVSWLGLCPEDEDNARRLLQAIQKRTWPRRAFVTAQSFEDITIKDLVDYGYKENGVTGLFTHKTTAIFDAVSQWFHVSPGRRAI